MDNNLLAKIRSDAAVRSTFTAYAEKVAAQSNCYVANIPWTDDAPLFDAFLLAVAVAASGSPPSPPPKPLRSDLAVHKEMTKLTQAIAEFGASVEAGREGAEGSRSFEAEYDDLFSAVLSALLRAGWRTPSEETNKAVVDAMVGAVHSAMRASSGSTGAKISCISPTVREGEPQPQETARRNE